MSNYKVPFLDLKKINSRYTQCFSETLQSVIADSQLILGSEVNAFEARFANYTGSSNCVSVGSGLDALTLLLQSLNIQTGDEVLVPAQTFIATWLSITQLGAVPVPVDIDVNTYTINPRLAEQKITSKTRAIVAVHLFGHMANLHELKSLASRYSLILVEDAAQAHGSSYFDKAPGLDSDGAAWSFYPGKNLGALGDGGAVTVESNAVAERVRLLRNYGSSKRYIHLIQGTNSRLDSLQAAFLSHKLLNLDDDNSCRSQIAKAYTQGIVNPDIIIPKVEINYTHSWHLFVIQHPARDRLQNYLNNLGIQTLIHYPVLPFLQPAFAALGSRYTESDFPVASQLSSRCLSLPIGPHLTTNDASIVVDALNSFS